MPPQESLWCGLEDVVRVDWAELGQLGTTSDQKLARQDKAKPERQVEVHWATPRLCYCDPR